MILLLGMYNSQRRSMCVKDKKGTFRVWHNERSLKIGSNL